MLLNIKSFWIANRQSVYLFLEKYKQHVPPVVYLDGVSVTFAELVKYCTSVYYFMLPWRMINTLR